MKVIVISGASSKVGKTTLMLGLLRVLPGAEAVKIGHGPRKARIGNHCPTMGEKPSPSGENFSSIMCVQRYRASELHVVSSEERSFSFESPRLQARVVYFYEVGTPFATIRKNHAEARWLLVESNSILREIQPDLVIYLEGPHPKPSASEARRRADIISETQVTQDDAARLAVRLGITPDLMQTILRLVPGASPQLR